MEDPNEPSEHVENERRWIVTSIDPDFTRHEARLIRQGYIEQGSPENTLRVRIVDDTHGILTRKTGHGQKRHERNLPISADAARMLITIDTPSITKLRRLIDGWELDQYQEKLAGLLILEREFDENEDDRIELPPWIHAAVEVTESVTNYHLAHLARDLLFRHGCILRRARDYGMTDEVLGLIRTCLH